MLEVLEALLAIELELGLGFARADQELPHGNAAGPGEGLGQEQGLVVPALSQTGRVQGYWHQGPGPLKLGESGQLRRHPQTRGLGRAFLAPVFEGVNY